MDFNLSNINYSNLEPICTQVIYNPPNILYVLIPMSLGVLFSTFLWVKIREMKKEKAANKKDLDLLEWVNVGVFIVIQAVFLMLGYYF